jgi:uncharacterized protein
MEVKEGRVFIGRLQYKEDLLRAISEFCVNEDISLGVFTIIGAVTSVSLGYYDQAAKKYIDCVSLEKKLEILSCTGNVSLKEGVSFVHAHITLADHQAQCYGGHLMPGAEIFAAEYFIKELTGTQLERQLDSQTGLSMWKV